MDIYESHTFRYAFKMNFIFLANGVQMKIAGVGNGVSKGPFCRKDRLLVNFHGSFAFSGEVDQIQKLSAGNFLLSVACLLLTANQVVASKFDSWPTARKECLWNPT